jgi:hypothetical protein
MAERGLQLPHSARPGLLGGPLDRAVSLPGLSAEGGADRLDLRQGFGEHADQDRPVGVGGDAEQDHPGMVEVPGPLQPAGLAGSALVLTVAMEPAHEYERTSIADGRLQ